MKFQRKCIYMSMLEYYLVMEMLLVENISSIMHSYIWAFAFRKNSKK